MKYGIWPGNMRKPLEMLAAIIAEVGADKTGIRVSPGHTFNDLVENDVPELCAHYLEQLQTRRVASLHVVRPFANDGALDLQSSPISFTLETP